VFNPWQPGTPRMWRRTANRVDHYPPVMVGMGQFAWIAARCALRPSVGCRRSRAPLVPMPPNHVGRRPENPIRLKLMIQGVTLVGGKIAPPLVTPPGVLLIPAPVSHES